MKNRLGTALIIIFGLYLIVTLTRSIYELREQGKKVAEDEQSLIDLKRENSELKKKLGETESQDFVEKIARDKLDLVKPGETVIILPEELQNPKPIPPPEKPLPNWQQWYKLFF